MAALALALVATDETLIPRLKDIANEAKIPWDERINRPYLLRCTKVFWQLRNSAALTRVTRKD